MQSIYHTKPIDFNDILPDFAPHPLQQNRADLCIYGTNRVL